MFEWWPKGRIRGEYRDPMTGQLARGMVSIETPKTLRSATRNVVIPRGRVFYQNLNTEESLGHSFDIEVMTTDGIPEEDWGWIVKVVTATHIDEIRDVRVTANTTYDTADRYK